MDIKVPKGQEFYKGNSHSFTLVGDITFSPTLEQRLNNAFGIDSLFQKFWDEMLLTSMTDYTPFQTGALTNSGRLNTVIGNGFLVWNTPYARYLWYGKVLEGDPPIPTEIDLRFNTKERPNAGPFWGIRASNEKLPEWNTAAQNFIDSGRAGI